jgi:lysophospholipid acyltransferase (LPLAT)-like uncharacterized protein
MTRFIKTRLLPYALYVFYRLYMATVRYIEPELPKELRKNKRFIVAHFHQDELVLAKTRIGSKFFTMTSTSTDGEMMTRLLRLLGYQCIRGSSTRGGSSALLEMITAMKTSIYNSVLAVDGPRGPIYKVKKGVVILSKQTGYPILPVGVKLSSAFCIQNSWNKALIPKPFSKVEIKFGNVISVPSTADDKNAEQLGLELEKSLLGLKDL